MKKLILVLLSLGNTLLYGQVVNTGQVIHVEDNGLLFVADNYSHLDGELSGKGTLELKADWDNKSATSVFNLNSDIHVVLSGGAQHIRGNKTTFPNLSLAGKGDKTIDFDTDISGILDLGDKNLNTQSFTLSILNPNADAINRTTGFITTDNNGVLLRHLNSVSPYSYPLGSLKNNPAFSNLNPVDISPLYRPLTITPENSQHNVFSATLSNYDPDTQFLRVNKSNELTDISDRYFYMLNQDFGVSKANVRFFQVSSVDRNSVIVDWSQSSSMWLKLPTIVKEGDFGDRLNRSLEFNSDGTLKDLPVTFANSVGQVNPFVFYNAFSPDGDGKNDTWQIKNIEMYPNNTLTVFNRWGDEVFKASNYSNMKAWDGSGLQSGTYFYVLSVMINGQSQNYKGFITMIKKD